MGGNQMNKEYYQAKADLCRDLAVKQMVEGDSKRAGENLIRMVNSLNQIELIKHREDKLKDKCVTCNQEKDSFSKEWEYSQCQSCSMKEEKDNG
jgi:DNA-directed RNA polymerase subunit RPC12/RpoP